MNDIVWAPDLARQKKSSLWAFRDRVRAAGHQLVDETYEALHRWSIEHPAAFWELVAKEIVFRKPATSTLINKGMPGSTWFEGAEFNFSENLMKRQDGTVAITAANEAGVVSRLSWADLWREVGRVQKGLIDLGIGRGDRVVGYLPNVPEAVIAMLAAAGLGATWSSCSPDFGFQGVMDRFGQISPKVLIAPDQIFYNGKWIDVHNKVNQLVDSLGSLQATVIVSYPGGPFHDACRKDIGSGRMLDWSSFGHEAAPIFVPLPFDHPLYIMYSSGTTGVPKCIVHGAGGTLLAHLKEHGLHGDTGPDDVVFYYTTCGWMMWNWLVSALARGAGIVLYDGSPLQPDPGVLFRLVDDVGITHFGTSPKYISAVMKSGYEPGVEHDLRTLRTIMSTGAPLLPEHFAFVYTAIKRDVQLASISGGTDIIGCFMLGNPLMPVRLGEIQAPGLGLDVQSWNDDGQPTLAEKGELVCAAPFPNMPIGFWNDPDDVRYRAAYFDRYKGIWWHGDYIEITPAGGVVVYGRSDATLNPGGVRIGTAEIYRQAESLDWVKDSVVVGIPTSDDLDVVLFVVVDGELTDERSQELRTVIRRGASPRHVPARIHAVPEVPRTLSGKKVEKAVRLQVLGEAVTNRDALANPDALEAYAQFR